MIKSAKILMPLLLLFLTSVARAQETVAVDLSVNNGSAIGRASGFLHAFNSTTPTTSTYVTPLKPQEMRSDYVYDEDPSTYATVVGMGAKPMYILGDAWIDNWGNYNPTNARVVTSATMSTWVTFVQARVNAALAAGQTQFQWDIWNEPDISDFWTGTPAQFYAAWQAAQAAIKGINSSQLVVGPSICCNSAFSMQDFLSFAHSNNVLPDVLDWHEASYEPSQIPVDYGTYSGYVGANNLGITKYSITEYGTDSNTYLPGSNVQYFAAIERAQLYESSHACWNNGNDCAQNGYPPDLDGALQTNATTQNALWYAYQAYANITGTVVGVTPSATVDGVAGQDSNLQQAYSVFGRNGGSTANITVTFNNVGSAAYLGAAGAVHVVAYSLPNDNGSGSSGPTQVISADYPVSSNSVSVTIPNMGSNDVAIVQLTPGAGSGSTRPSPPVVSQLVVH